MKIKIGLVKIGSWNKNARKRITAKSDGDASFP